MKRQIMRGLSLMMTGVMLMGVAAGCQSKKTDKTPETAGYRAIAPYHMDFVAVGTDGKISTVDVDTKKATDLKSPVSVTLRDIVAYNGELLAVGDEGTVVFSKDGTNFEKRSAGVDADLYAIARWNERYVAGGTDGTLLYSEDGKSWKSLSSGVTDTITGLAASNELCIGVTDSGKAVISENLTDWRIMEYNDYYQKKTSFSRITWSGTIFSAIGQDEKEGAVVATTLSGEVWTVRDLSYYNSAPQDVSDLTVSGQAWDGDQWYMSCNKGRIYTIPDCAQCFKTEEVGGGNLTAVAYNGGKVAVVGEQFTAVVVDTEAVRQYGIKSDAALQHQQQGAVIIDVREPDEYAPRHIKGAVNLPVGSIETTLPEKYPGKSTELIFYCMKGTRSQQALEKARKLGYTTVYSFGKIDDWTHEFEGTDVQK